MFIFLKLHYNVFYHCKSNFIPLFNKKYFRIILRVCCFV